MLNILLYAQHPFICLTFFYIPTSFYTLNIFLYSHTSLTSHGHPAPNLNPRIQQIYPTLPASSPILICGVPLDLCGEQQMADREACNEQMLLDGVFSLLSSEIAVEDSRVTLKQAAV